MADLLLQLERHDTFPGSDAIERIFVVDPPEGFLEGSLAAIWQTLGAETQQGLASWAAMRLDHWHSLKTNALCSAWDNDPGAETEHKQRCDAILRAMLIDLKAGLQRHPELIPDALSLQEMAVAGHAFCWSQVYKELSEERPDFDLQPTNPDFVLYCQLCSHAFRGLLS